MEEKFAEIVLAPAREASRKGADSALRTFEAAFDKVLPKIFVAGVCSRAELGTHMVEKADLDDMKAKADAALPVVNELGETSLSLHIQGLKYIGVMAFAAACVKRIGFPSLEATPAPSWRLAGDESLAPDGPVAAINAFTEAWKDLAHFRKQAEDSKEGAGLYQRHNWLPVLSNVFGEVYSKVVALRSGIPHRP